METLEQLQDFFVNHNVNGWAERTGMAIRQLQAGMKPSSALHDFIGAGMGSLIDLYICTDNGHSLNESEVEANKELEKLTEKILTMKNALQ